MTILHSRQQDIVMDAASREVTGDKRENGEVDGSEQGVRQMENDEMDVAVGEKSRRRVTETRYSSRGETRPGTVAQLPCEYQNNTQ